MILLMFASIPQSSSVTVRNEKEVWLGPIEYKVSAETSYPYDDHVFVSLKLMKINETANQTQNITPILVMGIITSIIITYDYCSKVFTTNATLFKYENNTYTTNNYTFRLHFPIEKTGTWILNITITILTITVALMIVLVLEVPITISVTANVIGKIVPENSILFYWLCGLTGVVAAQTIAIIYLIKRNRRPVKGEKPTPPAK